MKAVNSEKQYDVIVVGGGISGLITTRELRQLGYNVLLLEGRDRLGGRTWTDHRLGKDLELGGTYVHWYHPHLWSEITRYSLELSEPPAPKKIYWITDEKLHSGTPAEHNAIVRNGFERLLKNGSSQLPFPFDPMSSDSFKDYDQMTVKEYMDGMDLTDAERDFISSLLATDFNGDYEKGAVTQIFRWWAFSNGDRGIFANTVSRFKLKKGMSHLIKSILADMDADINLNTVVTHVEQRESNVEILSENNQVFQAKTVVITAPYSTLDKIEFKPSLSKEKQEFIHQEQVSNGIKVWAKVKGEIEPFVAYAPRGYPLNSLHVDSYHNGYSYLVGFGSDVTKVDINNKDEVQHAMRIWLPDLEIEACAGHNWISDEMSRETWTMLKPNQFIKYINEMNTPENNVFFSGTAYAMGWGGFIDGAIESALKTSRKVHQQLKNNKERKDLRCKR